MSSILELKKDLARKSSYSRAKVSERFFKTGKGEYGEGDVFIGVVVPDIRKVAKMYKDFSLRDMERLIKTKIHEERFLALVLLVEQFKTYNKKKQKKIYDFYLKNIKFINNWDLVDISADKIVGAYLLGRPKEILRKLAKSKNMWGRRIAIIATFQFIKNNNFECTLVISKILLNDEHDLIQKAVGWMLREVGKRDLYIEEKFLKKYYKNMPRMMLRYAIEKFQEDKRLSYLRGYI